MAGYNRYNRFRAMFKKNSLSNKYVGSTFILVSIFIIIFSVMGSEKVKNFRNYVLDYGSYAIYSMAVPIKTVAMTLNNLEEIYYVYKENKKLKGDSRRIKILENELILLKHENKILKDAMNIENDLYYNYQTVKVLVGIKSSFLKTLVILAGKKQKISEGFTVISHNDLLGHIYENGNSTSRVLLITDINSRVPVIVANTNFRLILSGNNSNYLEILHLGDFNKIQPGDELITSGDGGVYPHGIPVGVVVNGKNNKFIVRPNIYSRKLDYVRVINWSPEQIANLPIKDVDKLPMFYE